jgi:hypothetical protein
MRLIYDKFDGYLSHTFFYLGMLQKMTADSNIPPNNMTDEGWYM